MKRGQLSGKQVQERVPISQVRGIGGARAGGNLALGVPRCTHKGSRDLVVPGPGLVTELIGVRTEQQAAFSDLIPLEGPACALCRVCLALAVSAHPAALPEVLCRGLDAVLSRQGHQRTGGRVVVGGTRLVLAQLTCSGQGARVLQRFVVT